MEERLRVTASPAKWHGVLETEDTRRHADDITAVALGSPPLSLTHAVS